MAGDAAASNVVNLQSIAFGAKLVTLCVILGVSLLGVVTGFFLNAYVYASRAWLPEQAVFTRPLHFDYNETHAVATAQFIKWHQSPAGHMLAPKFAKFLKDGQNADVSLELRLPDRHENRHMFQLRCDLLADDGTELVEARRALMLRHHSFLSKTCRNLVLLPLYLAGFLSEVQSVRVPHLVQHKERSVAPLGGIRVSLSTQKREIPLPLVQEGSVRVEVNHSWWQTLLALFRLSSMLHLLLFTVASSLMLLSTGAAFCSVVLACRSILAFCLAPVPEVSPARTAPVARNPAASTAQDDSGSLTFAGSPRSIRDHVEASVQEFRRNPAFATTSDAGSAESSKGSTLSETLNRLKKRNAQHSAQTGSTQAAPSVALSRGQPARQDDDRTKKAS